MWSEQTIIHPAAWSDKVERDLARSLGLDQDAPGEEFVAACAQARDLLAQQSVPQVVTLRGDGTATVEPLAGIPTAEEETAARAASDEHTKQVLERERQQAAWDAAVADRQDAEFAAQIRQLAEGGEQ